MTETPAPLRSRLISAAGSLVERAGSTDAVSLRAIAREAGVTAPAVYGHFADLEALLDAVLDQGFADLRAGIAAAVAGSADPVERLVAGCHAYVRFGLAAPARYRAMFGPRRLPSGQRAFAVLVDAVAACAAAGRSRSTDPREDARLLWTALHGVVALRAAGGDADWPPLEEQVDVLVARLALLGG